MRKGCLYIGDDDDDDGDDDDDDDEREIKEFEEVGISDDEPIVRRLGEEMRMWPSFLTVEPM